MKNSATGSESISISFAGRAYISSNAPNTTKPLAIRGYNACWYRSVLHVKNAMSDKEHSGCLHFRHGKPLNRMLVILWPRRNDELTEKYEK